MNSTELLAPEVQRSVRRFAVAWRNRVTRSIHHVAVLDYDGDSFRFQYVQQARSGIVGFRPFLGFKSLERVYVSTRLWPFFDLRIMDPKRPDYGQYVRWLGLARDADRLDVLARSGGEQIGDTVLLAEEPASVEGHTESTVLVRGASYATRAWKTEGPASRLISGDRLTIRSDPENPANPRALLLTTADDEPIGWVPDLLVDYVRELERLHGTVTVVRNNGPDAPWHARLLVRFAGEVVPGWAAFRGGPWPDVTSRKS